MSIVLNTDFVGEYAISQSCYGHLDKYIEKYEKFYLVDLLGAELYTLFIADLDTATPQVPQTQRFIDLFNSFDIDYSNCVKTSEGLRKMIIQFVYFHYTRDTNFAPTDSGIMRTVSENSSLLPYNGFNLIDSYNQGVKNYLAVQWFICDNSPTYPEENTQHKYFSSGI
jgi:hypothetical protein